MKQIGCSGAVVCDLTPCGLVNMLCKAAPCHNLDDSNHTFQLLSDLELRPIS